jgi:hypothetical protein
MGPYLADADIRKVCEALLDAVDTAAAATLDPISAQV